MEVYEDYIALVISALDKLRYADCRVLNYDKCTSKLDYDDMDWTTTQIIEPKQQLNLIYNHMSCMMHQYIYVHIYTPLKLVYT